MSADYGCRLSPIVNDTLDLHLLNPFLGEISPLTAAESPSEGDHDLLRKPSSRRGSLKNARSQPISGGRHVRSRTEFEVSASNGGLHPLRSAGLASGPNGAGVTRPHLSRVLNVATLVDVPPAANEYESKPVDARDVLVHVVSPGDSLARVSLKYGIPLADLRRANHLWTSDSIHLRTQLYIPIDKATRLKPITADNLISITPDEETGETTISPHDLSIEPHPSAARTSGVEAIRRVPISQMSFFPPPSVTRPPTTRSSQQHASTFKATEHARYVPHSPISLTSLLTSLPLAASTRDTIIARLSFESVSSSYSDRDSDVHELDDVSTGSTSDLHHSHEETQPTPSVITPKSAYRSTPRATHYTPHVAEKSQSSSPALTHVRHLSTSPQSYIPPHRDIRTVQMEPSPEMQIPLLSRRLSPRGKVLTGSNLLDADFELENII
ncbi:Ribosomal N-lysine methyltransferase 4 [Termitomyces sp. T112]|nr:Ribosomal N-lysine methyltransferase 4 [Termitomyces sp. T112]